MKNFACCYKCFWNNIVTLQHEDQRATHLTEKVRSHFFLCGNNVGKYKAETDGLCRLSD